MRVLVIVAIWLWSGAALAQPTPPTAQSAHGGMPLATSPWVGCVGSTCAPPPVPQRDPTRSPPRRARFAYAGAVLGSVSAGVLFGGALALELASDARSERITRGVWLGTLAVSTPIVALSAWLARKGSRYQGYPGLRRVGWLAYSASVTGGVFLWYSALHRHQTPAILTVSAGVTGALALLPHALDALTASRFARYRRLLGPGGLAFAF